jgi:hypothetical protein
LRRRWRRSSPGAFEALHADRFEGALESETLLSFARLEKGDQNSIGSQQPLPRCCASPGKWFWLTDFFDNNRYSHDPQLHSLDA